MRVGVLRVFHGVIPRAMMDAMMDSQSFDVAGQYTSLRRMTFQWLGARQKLCCFLQTAIMENQRL